MFDKEYSYWMAGRRSFTTISTTAEIPSTGLTRIVLLFLGVAAYLGGIVYHTTAWLSQGDVSTVATITYNVGVIFAFGVLYFYLSNWIRQRGESHVRLLWSPLVAGILVILTGLALMWVGRPDVGEVGITKTLGFDIDTGHPLAIATIFKMNVLAFVELAFAFLLLLRFRDLVLVKRTRSSQRNWYAMIFLMVAASLVVFMKPPSRELTILQRGMMVPAVILMLVNSLRLSWIIALSLKEKIFAILLTLGLLVVLAGVGSVDESLITGIDVQQADVSYLRYYSYPLSIFTGLAVTFGVLYCLTALLSLLFHLPTTGDFQKKVGEVAAMHSLTNIGGQVFDREKLFATIVRAAEDIGADTAWLCFTDARYGIKAPEIAASHRIDPEGVHRLVDLPALYQDIASTGQPLLLEVAAADHRIYARPGEEIGSLLGVPLMARDEFLGALFITKDVVRGIERDDVEAVAIFAAQAAMAVDNARLIETRIEKERLARELDIAREVQSKLLPQHLPEGSSFSLAASSNAAQEVGGDYYDFMEIDDNRVAFIIGDVSGKGTSAAFYMAEMQGVFRALSRILPAPSEFLAHANDALSGSLEKSVFISVIYGVLDTSTETLLLARAGHCPAAFVRLNGEACLRKSQGMGLGMDRSGLFRRTIRQEEIQLLPGDVLVFYTDGVVESRNRQGAEYGYDRLLTALAKNRHEDADFLHRLILQDLDQFSEGSEFSDDTTVVVLKWHGVGLSAEKTDGLTGLASAGTREVTH